MHLYTANRNKENMDTDILIRNANSASGAHNVP